MGILVIDGSQGEGGGQVLRTSLALSMVTGEGFRIERIRAGRPKSGLLRQHLAAVRAAAEICQANVRGAELGSTQVTFEPRAILAGDYQFSIGTAGSTTLVLQTILPALLTANRKSQISLEGGTHNPAAPPFEFLEHAFLPLINRMGPRVSSILDRHGFFPAGAGDCGSRSNRPNDCSRSNCIHAARFNVARLSSSWRVCPEKLPSANGNGWRRV